MYNFSFNINILCATNENVDISQNQKDNLIEKINLQQSFRHISGRAAYSKQALYWWPDNSVGLQNTLTHLPKTVDEKLSNVIRFK